MGFLNAKCMKQDKGHISLRAWILVLALPLCDVGSAANYLLSEALDPLSVR